MQGVVGYRVVDPRRVARRIDFALDLESGRWTQTPLEQLAGLVMQLAQQFVIDELVKREVRQILADGVAPIRAHIAAGLAARLPWPISASRSSPYASPRSPRRPRWRRRSSSRPARRSSRTPTRRRSSVGRWRSSPSGRSPRTSCTTGSSSRAARRSSSGARARTPVSAPRSRSRRRWSRPRAPTSGTPWRRRARRQTIDAVQGAQLRADAERARIDAAMPADVLLALAMRELAANLGKVEHLTVTPDMLTPLLGRLTDDPAPPLRARRAPDGVPRAARAPRHARAGAVLPRAARPAIGRSRSVTCSTKRRVRG